MNQHASISQPSQGEDRPFGLSARLPLDLRARRRAAVRQPHRPRPRRQGQQLHGGRHLRQGRALRRPHPPSRPPAEAAGALRRQGRGPVEGSELGSRARSRRRKVHRGGGRSSAARRSGPISTPARWGWCSATASSGCATPRNTPASSARSAPISPGPAGTWARARCTAPTPARWRSRIASSSGAPMRSPPRST